MSLYDVKPKYYGKPKNEAVLRFASEGTYSIGYRRQASVSLFYWKSSVVFGRSYTASTQNEHSSECHRIARRTPFYTLPERAHAQWPLATSTTSNI